MALLSSITLFSFRLVTMPLTGCNDGYYDWILSIYDSKMDTQHCHILLAECCNVGSCMHYQYSLCAGLLMRGPWFAKSLSPISQSRQVTFSLLVRRLLSSVPKIIIFSEYKKEGSLFWPLGGV